MSQQFHCYSHWMWCSVLIGQLYPLFSLASINTFWLAQIPVDRWRQIRLHTYVARLLTCVLVMNRQQAALRTNSGNVSHHFHLVPSFNFLMCARENSLIHSFLTTCEMELTSVHWRVRVEKGLSRYHWNSLFIGQRPWMTDLLSFIGKSI